jgi:hypothetical protein
VGAVAGREAVDPTGGISDAGGGGATAMVTEARGCVPRLSAASPRFAFNRGKLMPTATNKPTAIRSVVCVVTFSSFRRHLWGEPIAIVGELGLGYQTKLRKQVGAD